MNDHPLTLKARTMRRLAVRFNPVSWHCSRCGAYVRHDKQFGGLCGYCDAQKRKKELVKQGFTV